MRSVSRSTVPRVLCVVAGLLFAMALVPAVSSAAITITADPVRPVAEEQVTFSSNYVSDCGVTHVWKIDGVTQASTTDTMTTTFATAGNYLIEVAADSPACNDSDTGTRTIEVEPKLAGSIAVSPDPPNTGRTATLTATQSGGYAPWTYEWDVDDDGLTPRSF